MSRVVVGKFLELCGLLVVGIGFLLGVLEGGNLHTELYCLVAGMGVFSLGYWMERKYRQ